MIIHLDQARFILGPMDGSPKSNIYIYINKMNDQSYKTISIIKTFDKIQPPFIIKNLEHIMCRGTYLNITNAISTMNSY